MPVRATMQLCCVTENCPKKGVPREVHFTKRISSSLSLAEPWPVRCKECDQIMIPTQEGQKFGPRIDRQ